MEKEAGHWLNVSLFFYESKDYHLHSYFQLLNRPASGGARGGERAHWASPQPGMAPGPAWCPLFSLPHCPAPSGASCLQSSGQPMCAAPGLWGPGACGRAGRRPPRSLCPNGQALSEYSSRRPPQLGCWRHVFKVWYARLHSLGMHIYTLSYIWMLK